MRSRALLVMLALVGGQVDAAAHAASDEEVVITARRREEVLVDVPVAVTAISGDRLREREIRTVKDIARYVPGLNITSDSVGRAVASIRGIGITLVDGVQPGVGILVDGIYQPNTSYLVTPLVDVERVEVLRGPQGTMFGNNTLGGAINLVTRKPGDTLYVRTSGTYAGDDAYSSASASVSGPLFDGVNARIGAAYHHQDGFQTNLLAGGDQNPLTTSGVDGSLVFTPSEHLSLTLNAGFSRVEGGHTPYFNVTGLTDYTLDGRTNQRSLAAVEYTAVNLTAVYSAPNLSTTATAVLAFNSRDLASSRDADFGPIDVLRQDAISSLEALAGEVRIDTKWSDRISTLAGFYVSRSDTAATTLNRNVPRGTSATAGAKGENEQAAVFATVFVNLGDGWDVTAGLRYDHQRLTATNFTTAGPYRTGQLQPRFTLTKRWSQSTMTYASIARGFRGGGQNPPGAPNLIFEGDSVWTYELGAKFDLRREAISISTALFYNDYSDFIGQSAITPSTTGVGYVSVNLNSGDAESFGWELEFDAILTDSWTVTGGLALLHARITDGCRFLDTIGYGLATDRFVSVPDWTFFLETAYDVPVGAGWLELRAGVVGKGNRTASSLDPNFAPELEAYTIFNASISWRLGNAEIGLFATNVFDEPYLESYIDQSVSLRAGLPPGVASNVAIQGERRRGGIRLIFRR